MPTNEQNAYSIVAALIAEVPCFSSEGVEHLTQSIIDSLAEVHLITEDQPPLLVDPTKGIWKREVAECGQLGPHDSHVWMDGRTGKGDRVYGCPGLGQVDG
jgi:hypothetical protein